MLHRVDYGASVLQGDLCREHRIMNLQVHATPYACALPGVFLHKPSKSLIVGDGFYGGYGASNVRLQWDGMAGKAGRWWEYEGHF